MYSVNFMREGVEPYEDFLIGHTQFAAEGIVRVLIDEGRKYLSSGVSLKPIEILDRMGEKSWSVVVVNPEELSGDYDEIFNSVMQKIRKARDLITVRDTEVNKIKKQITSLKKRISKLDTNLEKELSGCC